MGPGGGPASTSCGTGKPVALGQRVLPPPDAQRRGALGGAAPASLQSRVRAERKTFLPLQSPFISIIFCRPGNDPRTTTTDMHGVIQYEALRCQSLQMARADLERTVRTLRRELAESGSQAGKLGSPTLSHQAEFTGVKPAKDATPSDSCPSAEKDLVQKLSGLEAQLTAMKDEVRLAQEAAEKSSVAEANSEEAAAFC